MLRVALRAALLAVLLAEPGHAEVFFDARVVAVFDGDTIEIVRELGGGRTERMRIRLAGIDAPEKGQPWGRRAREALSKRVFGKEVRINEVTVDHWGRSVGEVYADDVCVPCELLREGHAWVFRRYTDDRVLLGLEAEARAARRGLWALPEADRIPPWDWRAARAHDEAPPGTRIGEEAGAAVPRCGGKHTCREMRSCAEARFHLERCGLARLDADRDGIPCEMLCGSGE